MITGVARPTVVAVAASGDMLTITDAPVDAERYTQFPVTTTSGVPGRVASQLVQANGQ
jgi:hypothetical protein